MSGNGVKSIRQAFAQTDRVARLGEGLSTMDHKLLILKYIDYVVGLQGDDYLAEIDRPSRFTEDEWAELKHLSNVVAGCNVIAKVLEQDAEETENPFDSKITFDGPVIYGKKGWKVDNGPLDS